MVLYWTRSHSFIRFWGCGTTVSFPNKRSGREVQPLAALYPTVRLSPWRQIRKNIHSRVPGCGAPETDQDSCPGWLPPVPLNLVSPQEDFSPGPLTPRFKRFPATRILPLPFVCFLCGTRHIAFLQKHCQWEEFINNYNKIILIISLLPNRHLIWANFC